MAKLDTLFGHLDVLKTRLDRIPQLLKDFRQKVLTQAVTGKLTEEWREGRELEKWQDIILKDFTDIDVGPAFKSAEFEDSGIRLLRGENIEPGALRWNNTVYFPEEKLLKFSHLFIKEGNVILAMDRPIISTGLKLAKAKKEDLPCVLVQRVARFRPSEKLSSGFLYFLISSDSYIKHLFGEQTGTQIPHISSKQILSFNCILPPLEEQQEIVRRVESLFAKADRIEASYQKLKAKIEALPQALLAKAFRGELVEQLPTDLPAGSDGEFFAYVLYCSDGSLYKGFTNNLKRRYEDHKTGKGAEHTRKYMPLYVYHYEVFKSEAEAVKREKFFKSGHGRAWLKQMEKENRLRQAGGDARDLLEQIKRAKEGLQKGGKGKKYREDETELRMVADGKRKYGKR